jgi:hypothetical protein
VSCRVKPPLLGASQRGFLWPRLVVTCSHASTLRLGVVAGGRCRELHTDESRCSQVSARAAGQAHRLALREVQWPGRPGEARFRRGAGGTRAVETAASPTAAKRTMPPRQAARVSRQGVVPTAERRPQAAPNQGLELTASSVRSCVAPAFSSSSGPALI